MAFIQLKNFLSIRHFKLIGLIGPRAVGERVNYGNTFFTAGTFQRVSTYK
jgi:hypothetical protein